MDCDDLPQWAPGQPDNYHGNQDCATIWTKYGGTMDDSNCDALFGYICEFANGFASGDTELPLPVDVVPNQNFIVEITGVQGLITVVSVVANVLFIISVCCWMAMKRRKASVYEKVKMYASEEERL